MEESEYILNILWTLKIYVPVGADTNIFKNRPCLKRITVDAPKLCLIKHLESQLINNLSAFLLTTYDINSEKICPADFLVTILI